ncbi:hypothetical protein DENIS_1309 [Desulfonema ishimotonii]|uniref:Uncharacterized protein n=2 Tax=Desulfonema ishimotonii TaxID=45657 RepID=A0A401FTT5_9BACT|nr:hypothetical protein DENIS_1309 [Desulfonema ishimotonii]
MKRWKLAIGAVIITTGLALFLLYGTVGRLDEKNTETEPEIENVRILYSNSVKGLLNDPEFRKMMKTRYGLVVTGARHNGPDTAADALETADGLWFSGGLSARRFAARHTGLPYPARSVFYTALVCYTWPDIARTLIQNGIVRVRGHHRVLAEPAKLWRLTDEGRTWAALGLRDQNGPVIIRAAHPGRSDSGELAAAWIALSRTGEEPPGTGRGRDVLTELSDIYKKMGTPEPSSAALFNQYVKRGQWAFPLILAEENLFAGFWREFPTYRDTIENGVRMVIPDPAMRIDHIFIPLTPKGERFLAALQGDAVRKFAWSAYGLRSETSADQDMPPLFGKVGLPEQLRATAPVPPPETLRELVRSATAGE